MTHFKVKWPLLPVLSISALILMLFTNITVMTVFAQTCNASGLVYRDYNQDGIRQTPGEPVVQGIEVRAFDDAGTELDLQLTDANGQYTLTINNPQARIEFTIPPSMDYLELGRVFNGSSATQSTSVNFVDCNNGNATVNMGVNNPGQYCQANPDLATTCFVLGSQLNRPDTTLLTFPYSSGSGDFGSPLGAFPTRFDLPAHPSVSIAGDIGTTWGLAYHRASGAIFTSAFMKRHSGFGPLGPGAVYRVLSGNATLFATFPNGADPHPISTTLDPDWLRDANSWDRVGKMGMGDVEMSEDDTTLWVVNVFNRTLYEIPLVGNPPTSGGPVPHTIPRNASDCASGTDDLWPFAVAFYDGVVYVGMVCSAESTQNPAHMRALVYTFTPGGSFSGGPIVDIPLNYDRGCANQAGSGTCTTDFPAEWNPWVTTFTTIGDGGGGVVYPQPWLTDIEFDNGNMILGLRDRFGDQIGSGAYSTDPGDPERYVGIAAGDILRACRTGATTWISEGSPGCPSNGANSQGPGDGEFYIQDDLVGRHDEVFSGGLVQIPGLPDVAGTVFDPIRMGDLAVLYDGGIRWFSNTSGATSRAYRIFDGELVDPPETFGKANGLGDLVAMCDPAPIEIGNRVWFDENQNGIQDPGTAEVAVGGVTVNLYNAAGNTLIASTTTAPDGSYYFNELNVPGGLNRNTTYNIRLDNAADYQTGGPLVGWTLTTNDTDTDVRDSDGTFVNGFPNINLTTGNFGENNHTYDFGFFVGQIPTPTPTPPAGTPGTPSPPGTPGTPPPQGTEVFSKSVDPPFAQPGDTVRWIITVFNPNNFTVNNVNVTDSIPSGLEIISAEASSGTVTFSGQEVTFTQASLGPNQTVIITVITRVRPDAPFEMENVAVLQWGTDSDIEARARLVRAGEQPGTGESPWWRLPLLVVGVGLAGVAIRMATRRKQQPS